MHILVVLKLKLPKYYDIAFDFPVLFNSAIVIVVITALYFNFKISYVKFPV